MSRLYASIDADASKTQATRRGYKEITTHTRGWDFGIKVDAYIDSNNNEVFRVFTTAGSNANDMDILLKTFVNGLAL